MAQPLDPTFAAGAYDSRGLESLKAQSRADPRAAAKATAQKFEALFLQQLLSQMRQSLPGDDLFSSQATKMQTSLYDQQIAEKMAQKGTGLADAIAKQIERLIPANPGEARAGAAKAAPAAAPGTSAPLTPSKRRGEARAVDGTPMPLDAAGLRARAAATAAQASGLGTAAAKTVAERKNAFVARVLPEAEAAAKALGVPASYVVGQAALETGWGQREIAGRDGTQSYNLFGIKADSRWAGRTVEAYTTEVVNGVARRVVQKFRAYDSYAEGLADYAKLVGGSPRYAAGVKQATSAMSFATALKQGGYATDPDYARKLAGTIASADKVATRLAAESLPERLA